MNNLIRHELDLTGKNPDNLVVGEPHVLDARKRRILVPSYGGFYTESLVVTDSLTNRQLTEDTDFLIDDFLQVPMNLSNKEIATTIIVINPSVSSNVTVTYQTIGGTYSVNADVLKQQIETLKLDNRPVLWNNIVGKPDAYPPAEHMHDIGDAYGFEYITHALERIRQAILMGNSAELALIWDEIAKMWVDLDVRDLLADHIKAEGNVHNLDIHDIDGLTEAEIRALILAELAKLESFLNHVKDMNNPHQTTPAKIGAYTIAETNALVETVRVALNNLIVSHTSNKNNPHDVTAAQVGAPTIAQMNTAITNAVNAVSTSLTNHINSSTAHAWSAITNKPTITAGDGLTNGGQLSDSGVTIHLGTPLQVTATSTNIANADNHSHAIDKASETVQGIVELATIAETTAGTDGVRAVTPKGLKAALDTVKISVPNATTAARGIIQLATQAIVDAGTDNQQAVTPATLKGAIPTFAGNPAYLTQFTTNSIADGNHTHLLAQGTTAQMGIVQLATPAEATAGTLATKAVTPDGLTSALASIKNSITTLDNKVNNLKIMPYTYSTAAPPTTHTAYAVGHFWFQYLT